MTWVFGAILSALIGESCLFSASVGQRVMVSTFFRGYGEECSSLLVNMFLSTLRTSEFALFIFRKAKNKFKGLLAIIAIELITRHSHLRTSRRMNPDQPLRSWQGGVKATWALCKNAVTPRMLAVCVRPPWRWHRRYPRAFSCRCGRRDSSCGLPRRRGA